MKVWMKINSKQIILMILSMMLVWKSVGVVSAKEDNQQKTAFLIVIDNSGSMNGDMRLLNNAVELIQELVKHRNINSSIDYLVFNENIPMIKDSMTQLFSSGKETSIMLGIMKADEWVKQKIELGMDVKILFISDLFSSRYWNEKEQEITEYTFAQAKSEQEKIARIEAEWQELCEAKQMDVIIWKWKNACETEDGRNTITYLENAQTNISDDTKINGYQVRFFYDRVMEFEEDDKVSGDRVSCCKQVVELFETLVYGIDIDWMGLKVKTTAEEITKDEGQAAYIWVPEGCNIIIMKEIAGEKKKYTNLENVVDGVYFLEKDEKYIIKLKEPQNRNKVYICKEPCLEWEITSSQEDSYNNKTKIVTVNVFVKPTRNLLEVKEYTCQLRIMKDGVQTEIVNAVFENGIFRYEFGGEKRTFVGKYEFQAQINGEEVEDMETVLIE